jgi:protein gp37
MSDKSAIEWTDATWNPVTGCTKVSPGCAHCYAERFAERFRGVPGHPFEQGFDIKLWPERLTLPLKWKEPRRIFVNSMSDLFHESIPDDFIEKIFEVMTEANQHVFQVLTKRAERMAAWTRAKFSSRDASTRLPRRGQKNGHHPWPAHIWLGVSVENQRFTSRIRYLKQTPALIKFLSVEPLLGPVKLESSMLEDIHWVIVGGESGPQARPVKPEWVSKIREQCQKQQVSFFFKQWGAYDPSGKRVGKRVAGRVLDGRTWDEMPTDLRPGGTASRRGGLFVEIGRV